MRHNNLGTCCANCAQKNTTLGMLGWLPTGFGDVPVEQLPSNDLRTYSAIGLAVNVAIFAGGVYLWQHKHKVAGGIIGFLGITSAAWNLGEVITGKDPFSVGVA